MSIGTLHIGGSTGPAPYAGVPSEPVTYLPSPCMTTRPPIELIGSWPPEAQNTVQAALLAASAASPPSQMRSTPWVVIRHAYASFTLYVAIPPGSDMVLMARTADDLATRIRDSRSRSPTQPPIFQLIYQSRARSLMPSRALSRLLVQARSNNQRLGITGVLLVQSGRFMQWLEGDEATVRTLYDTIRHDDRHCDVNLLLTARAPSRVFPDWAMSVERMALAHMPHTTDLHRFLQARRVPTAAPSLEALTLALAQFAPPPGRGTGPVGPP